MNGDEHVKTVSLARVLSVLVDRNRLLVGIIYRTCENSRKTCALFSTNSQFRPTETEKPDFHVIFTCFSPFFTTDYLDCLCSQAFCWRKDFSTQKLLWLSRNVYGLPSDLCSWLENWLFAS